MILSYAMEVAFAVTRGAVAPRLRALDEARLSFRVTPLDCDVFGHMNNGRYLTVMDFGRWNWMKRSGLLELMFSRSWQPILGAAEIEYRRELRMLRRYELATRIAAWEGKWFWFEQRFIVGDDVFARGLVRGVIRERGRSLPQAEVMAALGGSELRSPEPPGLLPRRREQPRGVAR